MYSGLFALSKNAFAILKSFSIEGLYYGSFIRQAFTKDLNSDDHGESGKVGGSPFKVNSTTFAGVKFPYGGSPKAISIAVMPSDQTSAVKSCPY